MLGILNHPSSAGRSNFAGMYELLSFEKFSLKNYIYYYICNVSPSVYFVRYHNVCMKISYHSLLRYLIP